MVGFIGFDNNDLFRNILSAFIVHQFPSIHPLLQEFSLFLLFMLSNIAFVLHFIMFCILFFLTLHYFLLCICFNIVYFLLFITFFLRFFKITSYSLFFFLIINSYLFFTLSFRTFHSFILWLFCLDVTTTLDLTRSKDYSNW